MRNLAFIIIALITTTQANDWSVPCTSGSCQYQWTGNNKTTPGSMILTGPNQVLSDITPAAGWNVLDCDPSWSNGTHAVRMVCSGTPQQMSLCNHLFDHGGAPDTVVRLPQNCGAGPFAHVKSASNATNTTVPSHLTSNATSTPGNMYSLVLDYDFESIPASRGTLSLALASSTSPTRPLTRRDLAYLRKRGRARNFARHLERDLEMRFGIPGIHLPPALTSVVGDVTSAAGDVTSAAGHAASTVASVATQAASTVASVATQAASSAASVATQVASDATSVASQAASVATSVASGAVSVASQVGQVIQNTTRVDQSLNSSVIPITLSQSFTLLHTSLDCSTSQSSISATLDIGVDAEIDAQVQFGSTFVGTLVPLNLEDISLSAALDGDINAIFNIQAQAQGTFDTGVLQLYQSGLPGLSIPGIFDLGPVFTISSQLQMENLNMEANMNVTTDYKFSNLGLVFPPGKGQNSGTAQPNNGGNALKLAASPPAVDVSGQIIPSFIPRFDFGIILGNGFLQATVFMNADISGTVDLSFKAGQANTTTVDPNAGSGNSTIPSPASGNGTQSGNGPANSTANGKSTIPVPPSGNGTSSKRAVASRGSIANEKRAAVSIDGCVNVTGAINITGGMVGTLKPLFSASQTYEVFSTSSLLTQKCFGNGKPPLVKARAISGGSPAARAYALVHRGPNVEHVSRLPSVERRKAPASNRPNEVKPQQSKGSKSSLSCGIAGGLPSVDPLSLLTNLL